MKRKVSKKKIALIITLNIILMFLISLLFAPTLIEGMEKNKLREEVNSISKKLNKENINLEEIDLYLNKKITTGKRKKVEVSIEKYLKELVKNSHSILKISKDKKILNALNTKVIETNTNDFTSSKEHLNKKKEELKQSKESLEKLSIEKEEYIKENTKDKELIDLYNELLSINLNIEKYIKLTDITTNNIDITLEAIDYLSSHKDNFKIEENNLIFLKRNSLKEYEKILEKVKKTELNISTPSLIKDEKPPVIEANNLSITEGNSINIKEKVKCIDEVDDEVECNISGEYDTNKSGEYTIKISAKDTAGNALEKSIILTVNKKVIYKAPYYTEVIRNQNTVIVYGLDENNEYTKIIRVMPCSVGRSGQETPTGTFKTSDKYRWGGLYGGVWGQYSIRIVSDILFHSVPYYSQNPSDLEWEEYNKLGSPASLGCVRMTVRDVKWLFENCPSGMTVKIYDGDLPNGVSKPSAPKIDGTSPNKGWDPTDPDPSNPWNQ